MMKVLLPWNLRGRDVVQPLRRSFPNEVIEVVELYGEHKHWHDWNDEDVEEMFADLKKNLDSSVRDGNKDIYVIMGGAVIKGALVVNWLVEKGIKPKLLVYDRTKYIPFDLDGKRLGE